MSDITADTGIANFQVSAGRTPHLTRVTFGEPQRIVEFRQLSITDQWDIAELSDNDPSPRWLGMTLMAASITDVDGVPMPPVEPLTRKALRDRLTKLGTDGMTAVAAALERISPAVLDIADVAAAKN